MFMLYLFICAFPCNLERKNHIKSWIRRDLQGSSSPTPGYTQYHPKFKPRDLSCFSCIFPSRPFIIFVAPLWTHSNSFIPFLRCVTQLCPQSRRWGCTAQGRVGQLLPSPGGSAGHGAHENAVGPLGCQGSLLAHIHLVLNLNPQIPFPVAAL